MLPYHLSTGKLKPFLRMILVASVTIEKRVFEPLLRTSKNYSVQRMYVLYIVTVLSIGFSRTAFLSKLIPTMQIIIPANRKIRICFTIIFMSD